MNNFKFTLLKQNKWIFTILFLVTVALVYVNSKFVNIGFLQLHSIDEYVFHSSIRHMLESLLNGQLSGLFGYGFYQYGFVYFFINMLAAAPGILTNNYEWAIIAPRLVTSFFAIGSLVFIYKFARLFTSNITSVLFVIIFVTMPAFWYNATWFHPDWAMTFFLLICIYYLAKDNWSFNKYFKIAIVAYGFALAFKYQAITSLPILGLYIFYEPLLNLKLSNFVIACKRLSLAILSSITIFIICNPYILHPMGWNAFTTTFWANMVSNKTNHGLAGAVSFIDKINLAVGDFYLNIIFLFILILSSLWLNWLYLRRPERNIFFVIALNFLINFVYLIFFVNKAWQVYYLPVITLGILSFIYYFSSLSQKQKDQILGFICLVQIAIYSVSYLPILTTSRDIIGAPDYTTYTNSENNELNHFLITSLTGQINDDTHILLTAYTPFSFNDLNLRYDQVDLIFGALTRDLIDQADYLKGQKKYWGDLKTDAELLSSFNPANIIIIRKNIPFYTNTKLNLVKDKTAYSEANTIVTELYAGDLGYKVLAENSLVVIFKKI